MAPDKDPRLAQVKIHPAFIVIGSLALSVFAGGIWQLSLTQEALSIVRYLGGVLQLAGVAVLLTAYGYMAAARTTIDPSRHSAALVTSGPYAYSRNPIYLGWFLFIAGIGLRNAGLFVLLVAIVMMLLLRWAVVLAEEAYLEEKFGDEYRRYRKRVRRWL